MKSYLSSAAIRDIGYGKEGIDRLLKDAVWDTPLTASAENALEQALEGLESFWAEVETDEHGERFITVGEEE